MTPTIEEKIIAARGHPRCGAAYSEKVSTCQIVPNGDSRLAGSMTSRPTTKTSATYDALTFHLPYSRNAERNGRAGQAATPLGASYAAPALQLARQFLICSHADCAAGGRWSICFKNSASVQACASLNLPFQEGMPVHRMPCLIFQNE